MVELHFSNYIYLKVQVFSHGRGAGGGGGGGGRAGGYRSSCSTEYRQLVNGPIFPFKLMIFIEVVSLLSIDN